MKSSRQLLSSILKTTHKEQQGIRSVLDTSMRPGLRKALEAQLREYGSIESEAHAIASQRGWELPEPDPALGKLSHMKTRIKLARGNSDSRIADMMIQGNTKSMIQGLKDLHQFPDQDLQIRILSQKLLDCETAGIRQMQSFL